MGKIIDYKCTYGNEQVYPEISTKIKVIIKEQQ